MKHLVVCADGTWCTPDQERNGIPAPSNVVRLKSCLAEEAQISDSDGAVTTISQLAYYHPGVGTEGGIIRRLMGGAWGEGLDKNIQSAYHWLAREYAPGDRIFLIGFSRGAYTVRSLGGVLDRCGLLDLDGIPVDEGWRRVEVVYKRGYRDEEERHEWAEDWDFHHEEKTPIRFIGVWDTVGALGVPDDMSLLNLIDLAEEWRFHDTELGESVEIARHAMALDELRASFTPTLWASPTATSDVKQVWFAGTHSDVGGGYAQTGLSDVCLLWMIKEAGKAGLAFRRDIVAQIAPEPMGVLHDSLKGIFRLVRSRPRNTPRIRSRQVHAAAKKRHKTPPIAQSPYRPTIILGVGGKESVDIYARERWNNTGLYLPKGKYSFSARGEWLDWRIACGPGGTADGKPHWAEAAHLFGTALGWLESAWKVVVRNDKADFKLTRRHEEWPWFALIGVVANCKSQPAEDGTPEKHDTFLIGDGAPLDLSRGGYLYAYANDAWDFYGNNRGSVRLTVERV